MDKVTEERLKGVHPDLVKVFLRAAEINKFPLRVTCGLRTVTEQKHLVAIGASKTMRSRHLPHVRDGLSRAIDIAGLVDLDKDGKIETEEMFHWPLYPQIAASMKAAAKELGIPIEWGGDWKSFKDGPHFQLPWKQYP